MIYDQFKQIFTAQARDIAEITGQRGGGKVTAKTLSGHFIVLTGEMATGKKCYYDKNSNRILSEAPNVTFVDIPV